MSRPPLPRPEGALSEGGDGVPARTWPAPPPAESAHLTPDQRIARLERGLVLLRDHFDRTTAELLAEVNRLEDAARPTEEGEQRDA